MKLPTVIAAFLLLSAAQAFADDWVTTDTFGVDAKSCSDWAGDADKPKGVVRNSDIEWMFGFLTALVRAKGATGGDMTVEEFPKEIDAICAAHPQWELTEAVEYFAVRHKLISPSSAVFQ